MIGDREVACTSCHRTGTGREPDLRADHGGVHATEIALTRRGRDYASAAIEVGPTALTVGWSSSLVNEAIAFVHGLPALRELDIHVRRLTDAVARTQLVSAVTQLDLERCVVR